MKFSFLPAALGIAAVLFAPQASGARTAPQSRAIVYVAFYGRGTIAIYDQNGSDAHPIGSIRSANLTNPMAMTVGSDVTLYVVNCTTNSSSVVFAFPPGS